MNTREHGPSPHPCAAPLTAVPLVLHGIHPVGCVPGGEGGDEPRVGAVLRGGEAGAGVAREGVARGGEHRGGDNETRLAAQRGAWGERGGERGEGGGWNVWRGCMFVGRLFTC